MSKVWLSVFLPYSPSIPISHDSSERWDKCGGLPRPTMIRRKMKKKRKSRWSLAGLLLSEGQGAEVHKPGCHWRRWRTKRGQLLHSVSLHSFLCLFAHLLPRCLFFTHLCFKSMHLIYKCNSLIYKWCSLGLVSLVKAILGTLVEDSAIGLFV